MKDYIDKITGKINESKFLKRMKEIFESFHIKDSMDSQINSVIGSNIFDSFGNWTAGKIKKFLKKFGKKFKNEEKADNIITKIISGITRAICIFASMAFFALVIYAIIKLIPIVITSMAVTVAIYLISSIAIMVIGNALGVKN